MPAASPPWTWPSATNGLMIRPASSHAIIRIRRTAPVSASTSTTAMWAPNGKVGCSGLKSVSALSSARRPSSCRRSASSVQPSDGWAEPATWKFARVEVQHHVLGIGLKRVGGELLGAIDEDLRRLPGRGASDLGRFGAVGSGAARHPVGVAGQHLDLVQVDAGALGHDLGERGLVALAVGEGAGADEGSAVLGDLDGAELALRDAVGDLDVDGDPDPQQRVGAVGAALLLLAAQFRVAGLLERALQRAPIVADVVGRAHGGLDGEFLVGDEVAPAQLGRVHPDLRGVHVDGPLDHLGRLGPTGPAHRADWGRVGDDRGDVHLDLGDVVHAAGHHLGQHGQEGADPGVGAGVLEQLDPERLERAVRGAAELEVGPLSAAVVHGHHVLRTCLGPAAGSAGGPRQSAHEYVLDVKALAAEATAHVGGDDANLLRLEPQGGGDAGLVLMWGLGREPDGQLVLLELRHGRARLDGQGEQAGALVGAGDDHVTPIEQVLVARARDAQARVGARRLEQQHLVLDDLSDVGDCGERLVVHHHEGSGVHGRRAGLGDDRGHDLADVAHPVRCHGRPEHALVDLEHRRGRAGLEPEVGRGEHLDARQCARLLSVDRGDRAVRHGGAHEGDVERVLSAGVVDVPTPTQEEARVLPAANPLSDSSGHQALSFPTGPCMWARIVTSLRRGRPV